MLRPTFVQIIEVLEGKIRSEVFSHAESKRETNEARSREEIDKKKNVIRESRQITRKEDFEPAVVLLRATEVRRRASEASEPFEHP